MTEPKIEIGITDDAVHSSQNMNEGQLERGRSLLKVISMSILVSSKPTFYLIVVHMLRKRVAAALSETCSRGGEAVVAHGLTYMWPVHWLGVSLAYKVSDHAAGRNHD
jgi:hypothetical protein